MNISVSQSLSESYQVAKQDLISDLDPSLPPVLGTYNIVKWAEITSGKMLRSALPEDQLSVGMKVEIKHSAISLENATIDVKSTITSIKGPLISFEIEVKEKDELIATLKHLRAILPKEKLNQKINAKTKSQ